MLGLVITAPVILFSALDLRAVQVTDAQNLNKFEDFFGVRLITNSVAILIIFGILVGLAGRYDFNVYVIIFLIGINKIIESTSDICYGLMQKHERLDKVAQSMILRNIGALILFAVVIKMTGNLIFAIASIGIWWLLALFFFDKRNAERFSPFVPRFHPKIVLSIIWLALPLGIATGIMVLNSSMSRYFVEAYLGSESLGYFGAMAYVVVGVSRATMAVGQSASARLARYYSSNRKAYIKLLQKMLAVALVLAVSAVLFGIYLGKPFLSIVYKPEYAERQDVFIWLLVAAGGTMLASMLGFARFATRRFKSQIPASLAVCIVSVLTCWLLIPPYGMKGASWSMIIASITQCVGSLIIIIIGLKSVEVTDANNKSVKIENGV